MTDWPKPWLCPRCGKWLSGDALYGPCVSCRATLNKWGAATGKQTTKIYKQRLAERAAEEQE